MKSTWTPAYCRRRARYHRSRERVLERLAYLADRSRDRLDLAYSSGTIYRMRSELHRLKAEWWENIHAD